MTLIGLPARLMADYSNNVSNISSDRAQTFFNIWGAYDWNHTTIPDWGTGLWQIVNVYPDYVGPIAWVILMAIPFFMMWITHADVVPAAILATFMGLYIIGFVGSQYMYAGIVIICLAIASVIWSVFLRRL